MTLTDVAVDLYAVPPADFVAARTARVKQLRADGDRVLATEVAALRKPSLAAWAVNLLVRRRPDQVEELLALGARLQEAQSTLAGDELRELDRRRHAAMAAIRAEAHTLAADLGRPFGDAVDAPLESTLRAAMTDPAAAAAVRAGVLVGDLMSSGFGPVELGDAVAVPDAPSLTGASQAGQPATAGHGVEVPPEPVTVPGRARRGSSGPERAATSTRGTPRRSTGRPAATTAAPGPVPQPARPADDDAAAARRERLEREAAARETARRREREAALADVEDALARATEADAALAAAKAAVADVARRRTALVAEVERLTAELAAAQAAVSAAVVEERHARTARETAVRVASTAARRALSARERLDRLV